MNVRWMVSTDVGDYEVYAENPSRAMRQVWYLTNGRATNMRARRI